MKTQQSHLLLPLIIGCMFLYIYQPKLVRAQSPSSSQEIQSKIDQYTQILSGLASAKNTLANQISLLTAQIDLTNLKISQTTNTISSLQDEISQLDHQIAHLDINLNTTAKIFTQRAIENYKIPKLSPLALFLGSNNFNYYYQTLRYTRQLQQYDHDLRISLETTRTATDNQKQIKKQRQEDLINFQNQLSDQKTTLDRQIETKNQLLIATKSNELKYQQLLSQARAELAAIQSILAGNGTETKVGTVTSGSLIATMIEGSSCSSSGTHLHFTVQSSDGSVQNPFNYLKDIQHTDYSHGDTFNPSGNWNWPLNGPIDFNQGYGKTWSTSHTWVSNIYSFHNGIDISSADHSVLSTQNGNLYRGKITISSENCTLQYVKVIDEITKITTYYLHVNY